jgi:hypothetical protein
MRQHKKEATDEKVMPKALKEEEGIVGRAKKSTEKNRCILSVLPSPHLNAMG